MTKKFERGFRNRELTADEQVRDAKIRQEVEREFPPSPPTANGIPTVGRASSLSEILKRSIRQSGKSTDDVARDAGVSAILVAQFLASERDIHMSTADKLAESLGLEITAG